MAFLLMPTLAVGEFVIFCALSMVVMSCYGGGYGTISAVVGTYYGARSLGAVYGSVFTACTHPPVPAQPREGAFHHPTSWQNLEAPTREQPLPIDLSTFLCPLLCPDSRDLLGCWLRCAMHDLDTQPELLLYPFLAPALVTCAHPQAREAWKALAGGLQYSVATWCRPGRGVWRCEPLL